MDGWMDVIIVDFAGGVLGESGVAPTTTPEPPPTEYIVYDGQSMPCVLVRMNMKLIIEPKRTGNKVRTPVSFNFISRHKLMLKYVHLNRFVLNNYLAGRKSRYQFQSRQCPRGVVGVARTPK